MSISGFDEKSTSLFDFICTQQEHFAIDKQVTVNAYKYLTNQINQSIDQSVSNNLFIYNQIVHGVQKSKKYNSNKYVNTYICKACNVSIQAESEAPAVARWVRMKLRRRKCYLYRYGLRWCLKVLSAGESLISIEVSCSICWMIGS